MYSIIYFIIAWICFAIGFFFCALLTNSKNRDYQEIKIWQKGITKNKKTRGDKMENLNRLIENYIACLKMFETRESEKAKNFWRENIEYWKRKINEKLNK